MANEYDVSEIEATERKRGCLIAASIESLTVLGLNIKLTQLNQQAVFSLPLSFLTLKLEVQQESSATSVYLSIYLSAGYLFQKLQVMFTCAYVCVCVCVYNFRTRKCASLYMYVKLKH